MRKYVKTVAIGMVCCMSVVGCSGQGNSESTEAKTSDVSIAPSEDTFEGTSDVATEESTEETTIEVLEMYEHGEEGYFSLVDEGCGTPVKCQVG